MAIPYCWIVESMIIFSEAKKKRLSGSKGKHHVHSCPRFACCHDFWGYRNCPCANGPRTARGRAGCRQLLLLTEGKRTNLFHPGAAALAVSRFRFRNPARGSRVRPGPHV